MEKPRPRPRKTTERDELWFGLQQWLKDGGTIPQDPKLEAELVAPT
jgi:hypothetical protein